MEPDSRPKRRLALAGMIVGTVVLVPVLLIGMLIAGKAWSNWESESQAKEAAIDLAAGTSVEGTNLLSDIKFEFTPSHWGIPSYQARAEFRFPPEDAAAVLGNLDEAGWTFNKGMSQTHKDGNRDTDRTTIEDECLSYLLNPQDGATVECSYSDEGQLVYLSTYGEPESSSIYIDMWFDR